MKEWAETKQAMSQRHKRSSLVRSHREKVELARKAVQEADSAVTETKSKGDAERKRLHKVVYVLIRWQCVVARI